MTISLKNTSSAWGLIARIIHWVTALTVISLFILGLWMRTLDYYSDWYHAAPFIHKSIGIMLFMLTCFRVIWRLVNTTPKALATHKRWERVASRIVHTLIYVLLFIIMCSGYLISTADGHAISVFNLFEVPAFITSLPNQEDTAGTIHLYVAYTLIAVVTMHALAALKHHFIDKDHTLVRMLKFYKN